MNIYTKAFCLILLLSSNNIIAQKKMKVSSKDSILIAQTDGIYQGNIKKSKLYGVYIPKDLDDAMIELDRLSPPESREKLKSISEDVMAKKLHFGLGRWISHNWNFEEGSRFSHYLKGKGILKSDDMVNFTLISYHRHIMKKPQEIESRAKKYVKGK